MKRIFKTGLLGIAAMLACSVFMLAPMCEKTADEADSKSKTTVIVHQPASDTSDDSSDKRDNATVYVLSNFSHYHRVGCDRIQGKSTSAISVTAAREAGYSPCPECSPMK